MKRLLARHLKPICSLSLLTLFLALGAACERGNARTDTSNTEGVVAEPTAETPTPAAGTDSNPAQGPCNLVEEGFGPPGTIPVRAEEVVDGLDVPWGIMFLGDNDWLVTQRPGRLSWVNDGQLDPTPLAQVDVSAQGEGGLLDILAHPEFETNGEFFLYTTTDTGNRVERWKLDRTGSRPTASQIGVLIDQIPAARYHNGGRMRVGPDGMIYIGTGDAKEPDLSQNRNSLAGKLLRVRPDGTIPADNPFGADNPVFVMGIRNTQGWDWADNDTIYLTDHGPSGELGRSDHDEVHIAEAGSNLGWPEIYKCQDEPGLKPPLLTFAEAVPPGGAAIYTGQRIPEWRGSLLIGTLGSRHLHRVVIDEPTGRLEMHEVYFQGDPPEGLGRLRDVTMGPDGELYVTTSNCDGRGTCPPDKDKILRIVPQ